MGLKGIAIKALIPSCLKGKKKLSPVPENTQQYSFRRLSLSDLSHQSSLSVMSDLSSSFFGSNLHIFTLKELEMITKNFTKSNFLGEGGFGPVFKGFINEKVRPCLEAQHVAVKVLDLYGSQGHREWLAEVIFLGQLRHTHLVNLMGYCCEEEHRLLVYEYMERGNLDSLLFKGYSGTLPWLTRIKIALGTAKGLAFLHEEEKPVIYRDFKASNILLDSDYNAKLSDFGLATDGPEGDDTHITTRVMGTEGYAAPEYVMTGHLSTMSDVFSFGVVLLELLTGRRAVDKSRSSREQNLVRWARPLLKDTHILGKIIDPRLEGQFSAEGAKRVASLAYQCLSHQPKSRPTMTTVVKTLEFVIALTDIPSGSFVYIVPSEERVENGVGKNGKECRKECDEMKKRNKDDELHRHGKCHRYRNGKRKSRSQAVHSDTTLYKIGSRLYSHHN